MGFVLCLRAADEIVPHIGLIDQDLDNTDRIDHDLDHTDPNLPL